MSNSPEAQRLDAVGRLTSELYVLQDRMNQTIDQITSLLHGADPAELGPARAPAGPAAPAGVERGLQPHALALPLPQVFLNQPANGCALGDDARLWSDYQRGSLQVVQVPAARGSGARFALALNHARFDGSFVSLVVDARRLLAGLSAGRLRGRVALEVHGEPPVQQHVKLAWRVGGQWREQALAPRGGRLQVDAFELMPFDPAGVDAFDLHLIFTPQAFGCIELRRASLTIAIDPPGPSAAAGPLEEGG